MSWHFAAAAERRNLLTRPYVFDITTSSPRVSFMGCCDFVLTVRKTVLGTFRPAGSIFLAFARLLRPEMPVPAFSKPWGQEFVDPRAPLGFWTTALRFLIFLPTFLFC